MSPHHKGASAPRLDASRQKNSPIDSVISRLTLGGYGPIESGPGQWKSRCPVHKGKSPNLSIKEGEDGTVLIRCHHVDEAGGSCDPKSIVQALNLTMADLFPASANRQPSTANGNGKAPKSNSKVYQSPTGAIYGASRQYGKPTAHWIYSGVDGRELMRVYRFDYTNPSTGEPDKQFRPVYPVADEWHLGDPAGLLPLYHLDELATASTIVVTEGEKCSKLVRDRLGLTSTTSSHGAKSPHKTDWTPTAGKTLLLCPDNDGPGEHFIQAVAKIVAALNPKPVVKIVRLPLEKPGDDIEEWLNAGGTAEKFAELADSAPEWAPLTEATTEVSPSTNGTISKPATQAADGSAIDVKLSWAPQTDTGNAERMIARHGQNVRHCHPWKKWLHYDGRRWAVDDTAAIRSMAKKTARKILAEASTVEDDEKREILTKWARKTESQKLLTSMIALASCEEGIPVVPKDLNTNQWLLNVENGTIDLRTGKLHPHSRGDLITALAPVVFYPDATCPQWDATLNRFFAGNQDLIAFWDRMCGIALTGDASEQILPILYGAGDNGKSTLVGALIGLLGPDYATIAPPHLLMAKNGNSHPTERVFLFGKRLVVDMESEDGARLNESLIKQLTGSDAITARGMNQDFWTFDPTHKLWLCTNHKPVIRGTDHAIWRRPKLVPFEVKIEERDKIKNFPALLKAEYPGILARCVRGCLDWQKNGLAVPKEVADATAQYRSEQDSLRAFIEEECTIGPGCRGKSGIMYQAYRTKTEHLGEEPITLTKFGMAMAEKGFEKVKNNGIWYLGIGLNQNEPAY